MRDNDFGGPTVQGESETYYLEYSCHIGRIDDLSDSELRFL